MNPNTVKMLARAALRDKEQLNVIAKDISQESNAAYISWVPDMCTVSGLIAQGLYTDKCMVCLWSITGHSCRYAKHMRDAHSKLLNYPYKTSTAEVIVAFHTIKTAVEDSIKYLQEILL